MNRIFVGSFLSGLVLLLAYQGVSAQRQSVSVTNSDSASATKACCLESAASTADAGSCCQDSEAIAIASAPEPFVIEPVFASQESFEFAVASVVNDPVASEPILQVGEVQLAPTPETRFNPFDEAPALTNPGSSPVDPSHAAEETAPAPDRIWIVIHPEAGLKFLQTPEEVALYQRKNQGTKDNFLIDCDTFSMEGKLGEGKPEFLLTCESVFLQGAFQTDKALEIRSAKLAYDTASRVLTLSGSEDVPVEVSIQDQDEMKLQAQEISLRLKDGSYQLQVSGADIELNTTPPGNRGDQPLFDNSSANEPFGRSTPSGRKFTPEPFRNSTPELFYNPEREPRSSADKNPFGA